MKKTFAILMVLLAGASAWAKTITYGTTQTVTEPLSVTEATTIIVSGGADVTYAPSATISGSYPITKSGNGDLLICSANGGFTGGFIVDKGYLIASNATALGTADVTVLGQRSGSTGRCAVGFWGVGGTYGDKTDLSPIYYNNNIKITGNTLSQYPAIIGYGRAAQLNGNITASQDFCFLDNEASVYGITHSYYSTYRSVTNLVFNGSITVNGTMSHDGWSAYIYNGKVKAKHLHLMPTYTGQGGSNRNAVHHFHQACEFETVSNGCHGLYFYTSHVLKGAELAWYASGSGIRYGDIYTYGNDQYFGALQGTVAEAVRADAWRVSANCTGADKTTITITGIGSGAYEAVTPLTIAYGSLVLDARDDFTQTFFTHPDCVATRYSGMAGSITVKKGTLKFTGITRFPNASALTVMSGAKFVCESKESTCLAGIKTLTIEEGATATFTYPVTVTVTSCSCQGVSLPPGNGYTHEIIEEIPENLTINVEGTKPAEADTVAVWTGAAGDGKMTTMANWTVDGAVPTSLDLESGTTAVRIDGGTEMIPDVEGIRINSISNNRTAGDGVALFYVGGKDTTLWVDGPIVSNKKAWWAFRGKIEPPYGVLQTGATKNGPFCLTHIDGGGQNNSQQRIYFAGATFKKPVYAYADGTGGTPFAGFAGTYNLMLSDFFSGGSANNRPIVEAGATVELARTFTEQNRPWKTGTGTWKFSTTSTSNDRGVTVCEGTLVLASTNISFQAIGETGSDVGRLNRGIKVGYNYSNGATLRFECDNTLVDNDKEQLQLMGKTLVTVDFGSYTQRFSRMTGENTYSLSEMTGVYPAMLEVKGGSKWTDAKYFIGLTNSVQISGGMGFHYLGSGPASDKYGAPAGWDDVFVLKGQDFKTTGNLECSGGTIELADDATWLNGTNFIVRGTSLKPAKIKFSAADQVDRKKSEFFLEGDDAKLYIPSGVKLRVHRVYVDGNDIPSGDYESDEQSGMMAGRITGGGSIHIHGDFRGSIIRFE